MKRIILTVTAFLLMTTAVIAIGLDVSKWQIRYSVNMPSHPTQLAGEGFYFNFPAKGQGEIDYLTRPYGKSIAKGSTLVMTGEVVASPDAVFNYKTEASNTCTFPASVRLLLQKRGDDLRSSNGRFWSNPVHYQLTNGVFTVSAKLTYDQWTNVNGQHSQSGFKSILNNMGNIGMTFGGGCFFGHGVNMASGTAKFIVRGYDIR